VSDDGVVGNFVHRFSVRKTTSLLRSMIKNSLLNKQMLFVFAIIFLRLALTLSAASEHMGVSLKQPKSWQPKGGRRFRRPMVPMYPGDYGLAAMDNLTGFRRSLMHEVLGNARRGYGMTGHERFDLYPPVVTCPPGVCFHDEPFWVHSYIET